MTRAPLLVPAAAFVAAVLADAHGLAAGAAAIAAGALVLTSGGDSTARRRARTAALFACAGLATSLLRGHPAAIAADSRTARFAVTVTGDVRADPFAGATFDATIDEAAASGDSARRGDVRGLRVRVHVRDRAVVAGQRLVVRGRLVPFDEARNPGEPSRRSIALGEGLAGELDGARVIARAPPDSWDARTWPARARASLSARLRRVVREPEATVLAGALWGERGTLPRDLRDDFQTTGTVHVLVTAGLHLGVVAALVLGLLRLAGVPRVPACTVAIPCVVAYAWLSGAHLPSQRAAVMVTLALVARACGARLVSWNALAAAALAVAALWPASVGTVSFALSFSCVAAIALFAKPLHRALRRTRLPERVSEALALTAATQIGVWPLSAATFGVLAPYALVANAAVVPATAFAMIAGVATLAAGATYDAIAWRPAPTVIAHGIAAVVPLGAAITTAVLSVVLGVVRAVASLPGANVAVAAPAAVAIAGYDAAAIVAAAMLRETPRVAAVMLAVAGAAVLATTLRLPTGTLTIAMLDVGQGDGIVVRTPRGHTLVIDSGGRLERGGARGDESTAELVGERVVVPYLRRAGVRRVELLVNTHPHGDHVGGFAPILRTFPVDAIADGGQRYGGHAYIDGLREAARRHVPVRLARCGDRWSSDDGVTLTVLSPCGALLAGGANDVNENSIVAMLRYGTFRMLFMGDAGFETEHRLLREPELLRADVLKVGHHGSAYATSPAFVAAVRPALAVVSVGRHNLFGHPAARTIAALAAAGAAVYRTDRCGAVTLRVRATATVETMLPCATTDAGGPARHERVVSTLP